MSTVAMTRMTSDVQDDSTVNAATTTTMEHEKDPENNTNGTRKSDSGVYFAMMLSEYLDKNANELPSDQLKPIQEITTSHNNVGQDLKNSNTAAFPSSSSISATTTNTTSPTTNMTIMNAQPRLSTTLTTNENKEENDNSLEVKAANEAMANLSNLIW